MALVHFKMSMMKSLLGGFSVRYFSSTKFVPKKDVKKSVFISQSTDIFTNLALEDWLYRKFDFTNHHILMLWQNDPCVVIGRHQNPWLEANVAELAQITEKGVQLARRNSGGGTVFHDRGNLNMTFFTPKDQYNRKHNLELITRAIFRKYGLKIDISPREDLLIRNAKISGTAAKLGRPNAYHHCTLLVTVNKVDLSQALHKRESGITTNATKSVKSRIANLCEVDPKITIDGLLSAIGWEYMRTPTNSFKDGGKQLASQQNGFQMINPTDQWFPGISEIRSTLCDWEWCYGKTPKFSVTKSFAVPTHFLNSFDAVAENLQVTMNVDQGRISDVTLYVPPGLSSTGFSGKAKVITSLKGCKFTENAISALEWSLSGSEYGLVDDKDKFVTECVKQVMTSV